MVRLRLIKQSLSNMAILSSLLFLLIISPYCSSLPYSSSSSSSASSSSSSSKSHRLRGLSSRTAAYPTRTISSRYYQTSNSSISSLHQPPMNHNQITQSTSSSSKVHGAVDCIMAIHNEISWCNQSYHQSLTQAIIKGYRKESRVYRRQYCCGHWSLQRCIFTVMQRKCDQETYDKIRDARSMEWNTQQQNQQINCDDYEHNSPICSSTTTTTVNHWVISISTIIIILKFLTKI